MRRLSHQANWRSIGPPFFGGCLVIVEEVLHLKLTLDKEHPDGSSSPNGSSSSGFYKGPWPVPRIDSLNPPQSEEPSLGAFRVNHKLVDHPPLGENVLNEVLESYDRRGRHSWRPPPASADH